MASSQASARIVRRPWIFVAAACAALAPPAAGQAIFIRAGDIDGFGLGDGAGLLNFAGDPVNVDGTGVLGPGDFLPDWNQNGDVSPSSGDDFDLRDAGEIAGTAIQSNGFVSTGSTGAQFTDLTLSQSYDATFGTPNDFPDPPSTNRNNSVFEFDFEIPADQIDPCSPIFFNIVFGDIGGGSTSDLVLTFADNSTITEQITPIDPAVEDGLIGAAFLELAFDDVLVQNGPVFEGFLLVELVTLPGQTGGDPYYTVDFAELSTEAIQPCVGDADGSGAVDVDDLLIVLGGWGPCADPCLPQCAADFDDNGMIDVDDLLVVLGAWGDCAP